jgi:hypothetical protein
MKNKFIFFSVIFFLLSLKISLAQGIYFCDKYDYDADKPIGVSSTFGPGKVTFVIDAIQPFGVRELEITVARDREESVMTFDIDVTPDEQGAVMDDSGMVFKKKGKYDVVVYAFHEENGETVFDKLIAVGSFEIK